MADCITEYFCERSRSGMKNIVMIRRKKKMVPALALPNAWAMTMAATRPLASSTTENSAES